MNSALSSSALLDLTPTTEAFLGEVLDGLARQPKRLSCKYFYDDRGSRLFEEICGLKEYYLTRTELAIMRSHGREMAAEVGPESMLVEYGSGSGVKIRILLDHLADPVAYAPVDISREALLWSAERLSLAYPTVEILPVCADFVGDFQLPSPQRTPARTVVYFPGSTIGNFQPAAAREMLSRIARQCGEGGGLLIGADLRKDPAVLEAAYNDRRGVTAEFNLNLLHRINNELGGDFDLDGFEHRAVYNPEEGRVEISLVSRERQAVTIEDEVFRFEPGEPIRTEYSYKYSVDGFAAMAAEAGLTLRRTWTDDGSRVAVFYFVVSD